jgi:hypothetical protein
MDAQKFKLGELTALQHQRIRSIVSERFFRDNSANWRRVGFVMVSPLGDQSAVRGLKNQVRNHQLSWWFDGEPLKAV